MDKNKKHALMIKKTLRALAEKQDAAKTVKAKVRIANKMAMAAGQLGEGWQKRALECTVEATLPELLARQAAATTVKAKVRLALRIAALQAA